MRERERERVSKKKESVDKEVDTFALITLISNNDYLFIFTKEQSRSPRTSRVCSPSNMKRLLMIRHALFARQKALIEIQGEIPPSLSAYQKPVL